jgi:hypothetical protein
MAHIFRLGLALLLLVCLAWSLPARADFAYTSITGVCETHKSELYKAQNTSCQTASQTSFALEYSATNGYGMGLIGAYSLDMGTCYVGGTRCRYYTTNNIYAARTYIPRAYTYTSCPSGSTSVGGTMCRCNDGYIQTSSGCSLPTAADKLGAMIGDASAARLYTVANQSTLCMDGIVVKYKSKNVTSSYTEYLGPFEPGGTCTASYTVSLSPIDYGGDIKVKITDCATAGGCSGTQTLKITSTSSFGTTSGVTSAAYCALGTCYGQINGLYTCVPCAVQQIGQQTSVTTGANGSVTSSVTTDYTCTLSGCSTIKITYDGTGAVQSKTTESTPPDDFCRSNPNATICKKSTFAAASCGSSPACDGDAVQCAIATEQYRRNCMLYDTPNTESQLYNAEKKDKASITSQAVNTAVQVSPSSVQ